MKCTFTPSNVQFDSTAAAVLYSPLFQSTLRKCLEILAPRQIVSTSPFSMEGYAAQTIGAGSSHDDPVVLEPDRSTTPCGSNGNEHGQGGSDACGASTAACDPPERSRERADEDVVRRHSSGPEAGKQPDSGNHGSPSRSQLSPFPSPAVNKEARLQKRKTLKRKSSQGDAGRAVVARFPSFL